ncbi:hypothetical protein [Streptosporangium saharense]|uniref:hypothetical protein n=1 Tax=Streptosporangium saharense TaxID=1706840 RepID=UPI00331A7E88
MWLLDVDGVTNASRPGWGRAPRSGTAYRMRRAPAPLDRIRAPHRADSVEIRRCSTWRAEIEQVERLLALPGLARAWSRSPVRRRRRDGQLAAARDVLTRGRRLIWTDDVEVPTSGPVDDELTRGGRALPIAPSPGRGLQSEHLDVIEAFTSTPTAEGRGSATDDALLIARRLLEGGPTPSM